MHCFIPEGVHLVERLVQHPSLQVHSWHLKTESSSAAEVRHVLVTVRELGIFNVILLTSSRDIANQVLFEVCFLFQLHILYSQALCVFLYLL